PFAALRGVDAAGPEAEGVRRRPGPVLHGVVLTDEAAALVEQDAEAAFAGAQLAPADAAAARARLDLVVRHRHAVPSLAGPGDAPGADSILSPPPRPGQAASARRTILFRRGP